MRELDLRVFWGILLRNLKVILAVSLVLAIGFAAATNLITEDTYSSKCSMYVMNITKDAAGVTTGISPAGLEASQQMVNEYITILKSDSVLIDVQNRLRAKGYKLTVAEIRSDLIMTPVNETAMLQITDTTTDPDLYKEMCDSLQACAPEKVNEVMLGIGTIQTVDEAGEGRKNNSNMTRNGVLGAVLGFVLTCGIVLFNYLLDNTVKDERELKNRFDVNVLGAVPDFGADPGKKKKKTKKKRKEGN